jgi:type III pantothenate kinase
MNKDKKNLGVVDIGNSRLKVMIDERIFFLEHKNNSWVDELNELIDNYKDIDRWAVSSVVDRVKHKVLELLKHKGNFEILTDEEILPKQKIVKYKHIQGIGSDRVFGLIGALNYAKAPIVTVDCGTAITINALSSNGVVIGGAIFAGVNTQLRSLSEHTDRLMEVDLNENINIIGKNTADALRSGIIIGCAGAINELIRSIREQIFRFYDINIFITGGSAELLLPFLDQHEVKIHYKSTLVLDGILSAM